MSIDSDVIRGHVDTIILKTLTTGDKYGYEIIKEIEQKSQGTYELKQPTLYSCLKRLENQGLISGYSKNSDIGGKRHYYKLTKKGRESYENSMQDWFNSRSIIDSLMGSKPTTLIPEDEIEPQQNKQEDTQEPNNNLEQYTQKSQEEDFNEEELSLNSQLDNEREIAQMVIDESSSITQESEPRDFENVNLDEDDVALLGDYYKTDENQIDLFDTTNFSANDDIDSQELESTEAETSELDNSAMDNGDNYLDDVDSFQENIDDEDTEEQSEVDYIDKESSTPQFKNFSGADLNKYKNASASNYFDSISSDNTDFTPIIDESREDDESDEIVEKPMSENLSSSNSFSSFNYFGNYGQFDDDEDQDKDDELQSEDNLEQTEEKREFIFPSFRADEEDEEKESETLHFGFGGYEEQDEDESMSIPTTFGVVDDIENEEEFMEEPHSPISIFGEESEEEIEPEYYNNNAINEELTEPIYSEPEYEIPTRTYISDQTTDLKPINIGTYSEPEHKEKLNQLSAYTKANYETKPAEYNEEVSKIEAKSIAQLKEDFDGLGIEVRNYRKPEREPLKDKKYLLVNKIKFATSWIVFGVMALLLLGTYFLANNWGYNNLMLVADALPAYLYYIIAGVVALSIPVTYTIIYLLNKTKKVKPNYNAVVSLIFALLFFVVCLNIIYTFNILNGFTKFTQTDYNHLLWLLPSIVSLVLVLQSIVYTILFKTKRFNA